MIYDIFTLNDELELLDMRLNIHNEYVDKFIIIESNKTFHMKDKSSTYLENKDLFTYFNHKIIHINVEMINHGHPFYNDYYQKSQCYKYALEHITDNDICYISDLDEILNGLHITQLLETNLEKPICGVAKFLHYFLNVSVDTDWYNGIICNKKTILNLFKNQKIDHLSCRTVRDSRANKEIFDLKTNYGYHYTYLISQTSGIYNIYKKLKSHSHLELCDLTMDHIEYCVNNLLPLNPSSQPWTLKPFKLNESNCPKYILNNLLKFKNLIYKT